MANAIDMPRAQLILGLSVPPEVLPGGLRGAPMEPVGRAVMVSVAAMLPGVMPCPARLFAL